MNEDMEIKDELSQDEFIAYNLIQIRHQLTILENDMEVFLSDCKNIELENYLKQSLHHFSQEIDVMQNAIEANLDYSLVHFDRIHGRYGVLKRKPIKN